MECEILSIFRAQWHLGLAELPLAIWSIVRKLQVKYRYLINYQAVKSAHPHQVEQCSVSRSGLPTTGTPPDGKLVWLQRCSGRCEKKRGWGWARQTMYVARNFEWLSVNHCGSDKPIIIHIMSRCLQP